MVDRAVARRAVRPPDRDPGPRRPRRPRRGGRPGGLDSAPYRARLLATSARRGSTELYLLEIEPGAARHAEPHIAGVVEHVLVLDGTLRAGPEAAPVTLEPGDLASFSGDAPHRYEAVAPGTRALLWMDYA